MGNSLFFILKRLLKENAIDIDEKELDFQLQSHPSYPSLHSLTGVLDHFNIQNLALEVPPEKEIIEQLPKAFIAYLKDDKKDDLVLIIRSDDRLKLIYDSKNQINITVNDFLKIWTGIIVAVEKDDNIIIETKTKNKGLIKGIGILTLVALFTLFLSTKPTLFSVLHILLSFIGLGISIIIVKHELGFKSKVADKFCSSNIDKVDCDKVLNSKAARFLGYFKLSDIGIVYFSSMIVAWALLIINHASYDLLVFITLLAVPFTFYSISYQYFKVKKWCLLCLSVVLVLWLQAGSLYFSNIGNIEFDLALNSIIPVISSYLIIISLWSFLLPRLIKEQELDKLKIEHYRFKRNYNLFKSLLFKSEPVKTAINEIEEIKFGNKDSVLQIVVITNPLCSHCREVHELVENILEKRNKDCQIIIRFNVSTKEESADTKIASRLLQIYHLQGKERSLDAMHDIYGNVPPESWFKKWGETIDLKYLEILNREKQWCVDNKINFTPEILVNGRSFPKEYNRGDLIFFIDEIVDEELEKLSELTPELTFSN